MRNMRSSIFTRDAIRVKAISLGLTDSALTAASIYLFRNAPLETPVSYQTSMIVADHTAVVLLAEDIKGKSIYVEDGKG